MSRTALVLVSVTLVASALLLGLRRPWRVDGPAVSPRMSAWIERAAVRTARDLGDPGASPTHVASGRYPVVVIEGRFVCTRCSGPFGGSAPTGSVAALRLDARTHETRDFALCDDRAACLRGLCGWPTCGRSRTLLDSAFAALDERSGEDELPFDRKLGRHEGCHIHLRPSGTGRRAWISGTCEVRLRTSTWRAVVTFSETWRGRDGAGRWGRGLRRRHSWRVVESPAGWVRRVESAGHVPPQSIAARG